MTLLAGFLSRDSDQPDEGSLCREVTERLDRSGRGTIRSHRAPGFFLAKSDVGAFPGTGLYTDAEGRFAALTGEPLIGSSRSGDRDRDLLSLYEHWREGGLEGALTGTHGVFSALLFDPSRRELVLATDKLGVRPLYVCETPERIFFSSTLRLLRELEAVPKRMDLRGVAELASFGYAFATRTGYSTIFSLRDGQYVRTVAGGPVEAVDYWRWDRIPTSGADEARLLDEAYETFEAAIRRRVGDARAANAFLSGGLDSRAIVCVLSSLGLELSTFNFSVPDSKDAAYGRRFAEHLGTRHRQVDVWPGRPPFDQMLAELLREADGADHGDDDAGRVAWAGDGGSVGVGHVYLKEAMIQAARAGRPDEAVRLVLGRKSLQRRLLQPRTERALEGVLERGIAEELAAVDPDDPGRSIYLFFLRNDQRRHLQDHFENLDLTRLELQLPFFDGDFLAAILQVPLDSLLRHAFYVRWLGRFPCDMTAVTWQAYPGHAQPPHGASGEELDQWRDEAPASWKRHAHETALAEARRLLGMDAFPHAVLRKRVLRLAYWAQRLRIRDVGYLIRSFSTYTRYWSDSGGKVSWS